MPIVVLVKTHKHLTSELPRLTDAQAKTLRGIRDLIAAHGMSPSFEEIGDRIGISLASACAAVKILEKKGYLTRIKGKNRTIRLTPAALTIRIRASSPKTAKAA